MVNDLSQNSLEWWTSKYPEMFKLPLAPPLNKKRMYGSRNIHTPPHREGIGISQGSGSKRQKKIKETGISRGVGKC